MTRQGPTISLGASRSNTHSETVPQRNVLASWVRNVRIGEVARRPPRCLLWKNRFAASKSSRKENPTSYGSQARSMARKNSGTHRLRHCCAMSPWTCNCRTRNSLRKPRNTSTPRSSTTSAKTTTRRLRRRLSCLAPSSSPAACGPWRGGSRDARYPRAEGQAPAATRTTRLGRCQHRRQRVRRDVPCRRPRGVTPSLRPPASTPGPPSNAWRPRPMQRPGAREQSHPTPSRARPRSLTPSPK